MAKCNTYLRIRDLELAYLHSGIVQCNRLTVDTIPVIRMMTVQLSFNVTLIIIQYNFIFINAIAMRAIMHYIWRGVIFRLMRVLFTANELLSRFRN